MTPFDREFAFNTVLAELHEARERLEAAILFLEREKLLRNKGSDRPSHGLRMADVAHSGPYVPYTPEEAERIQAEQADGSET